MTTENIMNALPRVNVPCYDNGLSLNYSGGIGQCVESKYMFYHMLYPFLYSIILSNNLKIGQSYVSEYIQKQMNCHFPWSTSGSGHVCSSKEDLTNYTDIMK
jgi:hypothetical protein